MSLSLGRYPTPLYECKPLRGSGAELWIKDDGVTSELYGGNKVRKIERLLGSERLQRARHLYTAGAAGSHFALALAVFAPDVGQEVTAWLWPHPDSDHAATSLARLLAQGASLRIAASAVEAIGRALVDAIHDPAGAFVPTGGAGLDATLGYVAAAQELAAQLQAQQVTAPDLLVVASGTGGTAAGLLAGLGAARLATRVAAVSVARNPLCRLQILAQAAQASRALGNRASLRDLAARLVVLNGYAGPGYGWPTPEARRAMNIGQTVGLGLDGTYTAKAFAAALTALGHRDFHPHSLKLPIVRPRRVLYWHTLSRAFPESRLEGTPAVDEVRRSYSALFIDHED